MPLTESPRGSNANSISPASAAPRRTAARRRFIERGAIQRGVIERRDHLQRERHPAVTAIPAEHPEDGGVGERGGGNADGGGEGVEFAHLRVVEPDHHGVRPLHASGANHPLTGSKL